MFPTAAVLRTMAVVTALVAAIGSWQLFWLFVALVTRSGEWSTARTLVASLCWIGWIGGWGLLARRLWRKA